MSVLENLTLTTALSPALSVSSIYCREPNVL